MPCFLLADIAVFYCFFLQIGTSPAVLQFSALLARSLDEPAYRPLKYIQQT